MPELPEVETVRKTLSTIIVNEKIKEVIVNWNNIIAYPQVDEFIKWLKNESIVEINRYGKWLIIKTNHYNLLSHLRMEGKYYFKDINSIIGKHDHVIFNFNDGKSLRYNDTRKFGKMYLYPNNILLENTKPLANLGLEPWSDKLTVNYLKNSYAKLKLPIKTVLLKQEIIVGIGNIYADEILFLSKINPLKRASNLTELELAKIIENTKIVLEKAIQEGGTTIKSYESSEGVHGKFQEELLVHQRAGDLCQVCGSKIIKTKIGGRGTYYCPKCQELKK